MGKINFCAISKQITNQIFIVHTKDDSHLLVLFQYGIRSVLLILTWFRNIILEIPIVNRVILRRTLTLMIHGGKC